MTRRINAPANKKANGPRKNLRNEPVFEDLRKLLRFNPEQAQIRFDGKRVVLADTQELSILRRELVMAVGLERARAILTRQGYEIGCKEAAVCLRLRRGKSFFEAFAAGPQLHALKGVVKVEGVTFNVDPEAGKFYAEYIWRHSVECESQLEQFGVSHVPGGWSQLGYASGYATAYFGRPIIYREMECIAMGHERCFLVGKLVEDWDEAEAELRFFRAENYTLASPDTRKSVVRPRHGRKIASRDIVGASAGFNVAWHLLDKVAATDATVLFLGESGVGKEIFARELHRRSKRAGMPLVSVNCAAIPESLIEAELFGVEKGAYTGATASRPGRFERAEGGTLFLDEIGTLSYVAQGKLLRAIQEGEYERVGDTRTRKCDIRIVAATNADLRAEIETRNFREDLYYRLNTFPITLPPLRERRADIPLLVNYFLRKFSTLYAKSVAGFTPATIQYFLEYAWPGNIRELENVIERSIILAEPGGAIELQHLRINDAAEVAPTARDRGDVGETLEAAQAGARLLERGFGVDAIVGGVIAAALERNGGNKSAAARAAGLSRSQINYWLRKKGNH